MKIASKMTAAAMGAAFLFGGFALAPSLAVLAQAQTSTAKPIVDAAKAKGQVGETIDGYLALVDPNAPADVQAAVNEINIRRKSVYTQLARQKNTSPDDVAGVSGEKLVAKAKSGEKVKLSDRQWHTVQ